MLKRTLLLMVGVLVTFSPGWAQTASQVGYTIVTPQGGNIAAFLTVATLFNPDLGNARADVGPAPILTDAALRAHIGGAENSGTALVLVNPTSSAATINLSLFNAFGAEIANQTISVPSGVQISTFLNSVFETGESLSSAVLRLRSNIPVAILALDFSGIGFTPVPVTDVETAVAGTTAGRITATSPPVIGVICPTIGVSCPGPVNPVTPVTPVTCPIPGITCPGVTFPTTVRPPATISAPATGTISTNGSGVFIFPQVVPDGSVAATVTVANLSTTIQAVRFDSFNSSGTLIQSIANVPIAPQGFIVFSSVSNAFGGAGR